MLVPRKTLVATVGALSLALIGAWPALGKGVTTASPLPRETATVVASSANDSTADSGDPVDASKYPGLRDLKLPEGETTDELTHAYYRLQTELFFKHPDEWGDAYMDGDYLYVNSVTRSESDAAAVLKELGIVGKIRVRQVQTSIADFENMQRAVAASALRSQIATVGPDYSSGQLLVGVRSTGKADLNADSLEAVLEVDALREDYAAVPVVLYDGGDPEATSRWYDNTPFYGGAFIAMYDADGLRGYCSDAFTWYKSPYTYMLTAGHCARYRNGDQGNTVKRQATTGGYYGMGAVTWASINYLGTLSGRHGDYALVRLNSGLKGAPRVYTGVENTTASRAVKNASSVATGSISTLRTSGASCKNDPDGDCETNPSVIHAVNQLVLYNSGYDMYNMTISEDTNECPQPGDSGGAFYTQRSDGGANAIGILSGAGSHGSGCYIYFTPISYVDDDFGGALLVD